jgi:hypothetical protein
MKIVRRLAVALAIALTGLAAQSAGSAVTLAAPSEHVCGTCTFTTIQKAINAATGNTTIYIAPGTYNESLSVPGTGTATFITLWASPSATVNAGGTNSVLSVSPGRTVVLMNVNLTNGFELVGGGIFNDGGTVTLYGTSSVYLNTATEDAGGIYNDGGQLTLHNTSSVHDNMSGFDGGGIENIDGAMATLEDTSSVYNNSTSGLSFAALKSSFKSNFRIKPAQFPDSNGGGIVNDDGSSLTLEDSSTVHDNGAFSLGGGIVNGFDDPCGSVLTIQDKSSVYNNMAYWGGGVANFALFACFRELIIPRIPPPTFSNGMTLKGAATIHGNLAVFGGGIYNQGDLAIRNTSSVYANFFTSNGGPAFSPQQGGGIYNTTPNLAAFSSVFSGIRSKLVHSRPSEVICVITNLGSDCGGRVIMTDFSSVHDNPADSDGGGIYNTGFCLSPRQLIPNQITLPDCGVIMENSSSLYNNAAGVQDGDGGGIANEDAQFFMFDNSTIHDNSGLLDGGGVYSDFSLAVMIDRSSIYKNTAVSGGGIYEYDTIMTMAGHSSVHDNTATGTVPGFCCGGGIANVGGTNGSDLSLYDYADIYHNTAYDGAGVYNTAFSSIHINNLSSIDHNAASDHGGGIWDDGTGTITGNLAAVKFNTPDNIFIF